MGMLVDVGVFVCVRVCLCVCARAPALRGWGREEGGNVCITSSETPSLTSLTR